MGVGVAASLGEMDMAIEFGLMPRATATGGNLQVCGFLWLFLLFEEGFGAVCFEGGLWLLFVGVCWVCWVGTGERRGEEGREGERGEARREEERRDRLLEKRDQHLKREGSMRLKTKDYIFGEKETTSH